MPEAKPVLKVSLPDGFVLQGPLSPDEVCAALGKNSSGAPVVEIGKTSDPVATAVRLGPLCAKLAEKAGCAVARPPDLSSGRGQVSYGIHQDLQGF